MKQGKQRNLKATAPFVSDFFCFNWKQSKQRYEIAPYKSAIDLKRRNLSEQLETNKHAQAHFVATNHILQRNGIYPLQLSCPSWFYANSSFFCRDWKRTILVKKNNAQRISERLTITPSQQIREKAQGNCNSNKLSRSFPICKWSTGIINSSHWQKTAENVLI